MAEPDLSTASNGFLIWHDAYLVVRKTSRTKENPSNGHLPKNTAAGLLGPSEGEARVSPGPMIHLARRCPPILPRGGEDAARSSK